MLEEVDGLKSTVRLLEAAPIYIVRTGGAESATARLQSEPLLAGIPQVSTAAATLIVPSDLSVATVPDGAWLAFHYQDFPAIAAIRDLRAKRSDLLVAALCSDIYSYSHYTNIHDITDVFVAPTEAHQRVLAYQLYKPVYVIPEAIDDIVPAENVPSAATNKRLAWFGYAESFAKGMMSVLPVIRAAQAAGDIDGLTLISVLKDLQNCGIDLAGFGQTAYAKAGFVEDVRHCSYAVLSHMPLDLDLNSFIKSPNKLVTSLMCGLVPLCSDTPNYADLLNRFGLGGFLFSSPADLAVLLRRLDPARDRRIVAQSGIVEYMRDEFSAASVSRKFIAVMDGVRRHGEMDLPVMQTYDVPRSASLREHLRDLLPSARRSLDARMSILRHRVLSRR